MLGISRTDHHRPSVPDIARFTLFFAVFGAKLGGISPWVRWNCEKASQLISLQAWHTWNHPKRTSTACLSPITILRHICATCNFEAHLCLKWHFSLLSKPRTCDGHHGYHRSIPIKPRHGTFQWDPIWNVFMQFWPPQCLGHIWCAMPFLRHICATLLGWCGVKRCRHRRLPKPSY